jgi:hypothetical protein
VNLRLCAVCVRCDSELEVARVESMLRRGVTGLPLHASFRAANHPLLDEDALDTGELGIDGEVPDDIDGGGGHGRSGMVSRQGAASALSHGGGAQADDPDRGKQREVELVRAKLDRIRGEIVEMQAAIADNNIAKQDLLSRLKVSCRVVSCRVVSCRVVSCRVVSCRVVSCRVVSLLPLASATARTRYGCGHCTVVSVLQLNAETAEQLRSLLALRTTSAGMKEILELEYRVGVLELENMELEHSRMLHDLVVRQKDMKIRKLRLRVRQSLRSLSPSYRRRLPPALLIAAIPAPSLEGLPPAAVLVLSDRSIVDCRPARLRQVAARDRLIEEQFAVLKAHGLDGLVSREAVDALDEQLRAEEEEDEMLEQQAAKELSADRDVALFPFPPSRLKLRGQCLCQSSFVVSIVRCFCARDAAVDRRRGPPLPSPPLPSPPLPSPPLPPLPSLHVVVTLPVIDRALLQGCG